MIKQFNLFLSIFIFFSTLGISQNSEYYNNLEKLLDKTSNGANARFKHILRTEFSQLINTNSNGLLGNYVGLSTKDKTLSFAFNRVVDEGMIELNVSGAVNDNITGIFAENKLKTNVELGFKFHKIMGIKNLSSDILGFSKIAKELTDLKNQRELIDKKLPKDSQNAKIEVNKKQKELIDLQRKYYQIAGGIKNTPLNATKNEEYQTQKNLIEAEIKLIDDKISNFNIYKANRIKQLENKRDDPKNTDPHKQEQFKVDRFKLLNELPLLKKSKIKKNKELNDIKKKINENTITDEALVKARNKVKLAQINLKIAQDKYNHLLNNALTTNNNEFEEKRKKTLDKLNKVRAEDIHLYWFSFSGSLANETYKFYDATRLFADQIYNEEDLIPSLGVSFSMYENIEKSSFLIPNKDRKIILFTIGAEWKYSNNTSTLKQIEIQTVNSVDPNRTIIDSQKALNGTFEDELETAQLFLDYYNVGWSSQNLGFHFRTTVDIGSHIPIYSTRIGILFSAKKKEDIKSSLNFELFLGLNDLFKKDGEDELFKRNIIGLQTTVPFTF